MVIDAAEWHGRLMVLTNRGWMDDRDGKDVKRRARSDEWLGPVIG